MGAGKGTGKSMCMRLSTLPFSKLPFSFSPTVAWCDSWTRRRLPLRGCKRRDGRICHVRKQAGEELEAMPTLPAIFADRIIGPTPHQMLQTHGKHEETTERRGNMKMVDNKTCAQNLHLRGNKLVLYGFRTV